MGLKIQKKQEIAVGVAMLIGIISVGGSATFLTYGAEKTVGAVQQSYVVTNVNDSGPGSLRQAITDANLESTTSTTPHSITFTIPGGGLHTIALTSALPSLTQPTVIDGTSQNGSTCGTLVDQMPDGTISPVNTPHVLNISLSTSGIAGGASALDFSNTASGSSVKGLILSGSQTTSAFNLTLNAPDMVVECNYIGTNQAGTSSVSNAGRGGIRVSSGASDIMVQNNLVSGNGEFGIAVYSAPAPHIYQNLVGVDASGNSALPNRTADGSTGSGIYLESTTGADVYKNLASGHAHLGIAGGTNSGIKIRGNYVGTNLAGDAAISNGTGIMMTTNTGSIIGGSTPDDRNVVSGNPGNNIRINGAVDTAIKGNYIGVGANGRADLGSTWVGLYLGYVANDVEVGGSQPGEGNIIANANGYGFSTEGPGTTNVVMKGNYIGTNPQGDDIGGNWRGVLLRSPGVTFGGPEPGAGNVVGFFSEGIRIEYTETVVEGNYFGVLPDGTAVGNNSGVLLGANGVTIGGNSAGQPNTIAHNVVGLNVHGSGNTFARNKIYSNQNGGIDLQGDGVTGNDYQDVDTGHNGLQNYPISTSITTCDGDSLGPVKKFNSTPNTQFTIDFYDNPSWQPGSASIQAEQWVSSITVTTDANGDAPLNIPNGIVRPSFIATAPDGSSSEIGIEAAIEFTDCSMNYTTSSGNVSYMAGTWEGSNIPNSYSPSGSLRVTSVMVDGQSFDMSGQSGYWYVSNSGFSFWGTFATPLESGTYDVDVTFVDTSSGLTMHHVFVDGLTVDTTPPPTPTVNRLSTNDTTPELTGYAPGADDVWVEICTQDGATCYYPYDSPVLDTGTGEWTLSGDPNNYREYVGYDPVTYESIYAPFTIPEGTYDIVVYSYDPVGNESIDATVDELVIDLTDPQGTASAVTGARTASPELTGTVDDPDAVVTATVNGESYRSINNRDDTWRLPAGTIDSITTAGTYNVSVAFADEAGNESSAPTTMSLVILPEVKSINENGGKPVIQGTYDAQNSQRLRVRLNNVWYVLGADPQLTANGNSWTLDLSNLSTPLAPGSYDVDAEMTALDGELLTDESGVAINIAIGAPSSGTGYDIDLGAISLAITLVAMLCYLGPKRLSSR